MEKRRNLGGHPISLDLADAFQRNQRNVLSKCLEFVHFENKVENDCDGII